jgi:hypothetical protein
MVPYEHLSVKLAEYRPVFDAPTNTVTVSAKVASEPLPHSAVIIDDRGEGDGYWSRSYAARVARDGSFQIKINDGSKGSGHYRFLFCFDNGLVTGDGTHFSLDNFGEVKKAYMFKDGAYRFD